MTTTPEIDALPWAMMDGRLIRSRAARVSVFDRSFQLGDGVFETLRIINGCPIQWRAHWRRLRTTARWLGMRLPASEASIRALLHALLKHNRTRNAILRIHLSRGVGPRGYSPRGATHPVFLMTMYPSPARESSGPRSIRLGLSSLRLEHHHPLQRHKTASRLVHILAKAEADTGGFDDMLLLDSRKRVLEATSSNFFWFRGRVLITPPLSAGILPGSTRTQVIKMAKRRGIVVHEQLAGIAKIVECQGAFLTVCTSGIIEIRSIDGVPVPRNPHTGTLHHELMQSWQREATRLQPRRRARSKTIRQPGIVH